MEVVREWHWGRWVMLSGAGGWLRLQEVVGMVADEGCGADGGGGAAADDSGALGGDRAYGW